MKSRISTVRVFQCPLINITLLAFVCCRSQDSNFKPKAISPPPDSVIREIPKFFQRKQWTEYFSALQSSLNMRPLHDGFKDWQLRIWVAHAVYDYMDSAQLIILTKEDDRISGTLYTYVARESKRLGKTHVETNGRFVSLVPKSGWTSFMDSLNKLSIFTLPDHTKIEGYFLATDSYGVMLEAATKNSYRLYDYPDYSQHVGKIPEAEKLYQALKLMEDEFIIKIVY